MAVILETSLGDITVDLYTDERPKCSENFLKLCKTKYYNWSLFHSVQRNLVAQTGDPTSTGRGGASIYAKLYGDQATYFDAEIKPRIKHKKKGTLSMVNNGSNMHGSQFFITLASDIDYLDGDHTVFGEVAEGFETLDKINEVYVDQDSRPYKDIRIYHTVVLEDPYDDPDALEEYIPPSSPTLTKEQLESDRIGAEEDIDPSKGKTEEEINEELNTKEAKANAQLLEMVGDLPDAEVNPEDNVLFVCKLNPVTTSEDLEIIFSRFGTILSCEVIKDQKTEESLQYAFIEFENSQECENAYFKMDNVLIDDRRIHVDFSQSVAKLKYKHGKGRTVDVNNQYVIRDEKIRRDGYDLVFSDDESCSKNSKKQKKKKKSKHNDQHWDSDEKKQRKDHNTRKSRSRSPVQRRRSPYLKDRRRKSQSPVRKDRRSPSPVRKNRRSPSPVRRNRRSPSPVRKHRRSPSPVHRNRRSPSPVRRNRRSPSPVRRKKRSPSPVRRNRRSPSPVDRSTSPIHKKRDREKRNEKFSRSEQKERKSRDRSISKEREHKKHKKDKYR